MVSEIGGVFFKLLPAIFPHIADILRDKEGAKVEGFGGAARGCLPVFPASGGSAESNERIFMSSDLLRRCLRKITLS